ncbi:MAG: gamma carbonic anhydrase family protein [Corticimicrobacter sp.]|uniref:gamma carbonic anhydrase family protein n=1 Tax=Corticimicrobacter sp. TaxID=2678536 RepID=UPI0032DBA390
MPIYRLHDQTPRIHPSAFVFENATVIGDVVLGQDSSIWPNATLRGDNATITIGPQSNIQDACVLHVDVGHPLHIGKGVTVGHQAMLHGCHIADGALIGMQAIILNDARIGRNCLIGAGTLIPEGKEIPDNSLVIGIAKIVRTLSDEEITQMHLNARHYVEKARNYREALVRID